MYNSWHEFEAGWQEVGCGDAGAFAPSCGVGSSRRDEADGGVGVVSGKPACGEQMSSVGSSGWFEGTQASADGEAERADPGLGDWQDAGSVETAVLSLDPCGGGRVDCAAIRHPGLVEHSGALSQGVGHEPAKAGAASV